MERILSFADEVALVNAELQRLGFPELGGEYRPQNTPRIIWSWRRWQLILDEVYLVHQATNTVIDVRGLAARKPATSQRPL